MISATVVADSKNEFGNRLTTFQITFPRIILAEVNTHRMLSKNTASSRAIPFNKLLEMVKTNPFIPVAWQKDHKGMQGTEYFQEFDVDVTGWHNWNIGDCVNDWLAARDAAVYHAKELSEKGATKQLCNRLLEPFMWCTMLISGTEWENFFHLRCPKYQTIQGYFRSRKDAVQEGNSLEKLDFAKFDNLMWLELNKGQAEIHMMALAESMWDKFCESKPVLLKSGQWHIPYIEIIED